MTFNEFNQDSFDQFREENPKEVRFEEMITPGFERLEETSDAIPNAEEPVSYEEGADPYQNEPIFQESSFQPEQPYDEYYYTELPVEDSVQEQPAKKHKVWFGIVSLVTAFLLGVGLSTWLSFLALPKLVEREMEQLKKSNPSLYLAPPNPSMTTEQAGAPEVSDTEERELLTVVEISRKVGPAVVGIETSVQRQSVFGTTSLESGSGSGIILSEDGYIVTNNHVIEGASVITVTLSDGEEYDAVLVGADARTDLAVVKIEGDSFPTATLGNSSDLQVGELAVAIGNPLGNELAGSVTGGYISALNRSITVDDKQFNLIQTDAAINPGNSGGALVNNYGEVIGINSVKMSASGVEGIGFAIPIDEAKPIIDDLIANGYVKGRPVIGIAGRDVSEQDSKRYGVPVGIYVMETSPYSAAERSGIKAGDVIVALNGVTVKTVDELNTEKEKFVAGDTVELTVIRGDDTLTISLTLQEDKPVLPEE